MFLYGHAQASPEPETPYLHNELSPESDSETHTAQSPSPEPEARYNRTRSLKPIIQAWEWNLHSSATVRSRFSCEGIASAVFDSLH